MQRTGAYYALRNVWSAFETGSRLIGEHSKGNLQSKHTGFEYYIIGGLFCELVQNSMSSRIWWMNNRTTNGWSRTHLKRSESPSTVTWRALHTALNERAMYSKRDSIWNLCLDQRSTWLSEKALNWSGSKAFHVALLLPQKSSLCIPF